MWKLAAILLLSLVVGALVGYFLSTYVVAVLTMVVVWLTYREIKPPPGRRGSGDIAGDIISTMFFVLLLLSMWITWFIIPSSHSIGFDLNDVSDLLSDLLRHYILK